MSFRCTLVRDVGTDNGGERRVRTVLGQEEQESAIVSLEKRVKVLSGGDAGETKAVIGRNRPMAQNSMRRGFVGAFLLVPSLPPN